VGAEPHARGLAQRRLYRLRLTLPLSGVAGLNPVGLDRIGEQARGRLQALSDLAGYREPLAGLVGDANAGDRAPRLDPFGLGVGAEDAEEVCAVHTPIQCTSYAKGITRPPYPPPHAPDVKNPGRGGQGLRVSGSQGLRVSGSQGLRALAEHRPADEDRESEAGDADSDEEDGYEHDPTRCTLRANPITRPPYRAE